MQFNVRCWMQPRVALGIVTISLNGCAGESSDGPTNACPPVPEYSRAEQVRLAEELATLPEEWVVHQWLADYLVTRAQVRLCSGL